MSLKIVVVEDSFVFQKIIKTVLKDIEGVGEVSVAGTGQEGLDLISKLRPDVVFLDLHLPDMDGMDILDELKRKDKKQRVVVVSGLSVEGADLTIKALAKGAQQFIRKPSQAGIKESVAELRAELEPVIKTVSLQVGLKTPRQVPSTHIRSSQAVVEPKINPGGAGTSPVAKTVAPIQPAISPQGNSPLSGFWVAAIAVSTGGPQALNCLIPQLPANFPLPIVLVQHMPPLFTESLANSLDNKSALNVVEAKDGMVLEAGRVYIAPGGKHLVIKEVGGKPVTALNEDPPEKSVRPAADVLFRSLAHFKSNKAVLAVVMTGMGEDGLAGVQNLKMVDCYCLSQTEESCVVYGMPRAVDLAGLSDEKVELEDLADRMGQLALGCRSKVGI